jgi:TPR repeat protein
VVGIDAGEETRTHEPSPEPRAKQHREGCARGDLSACHAAALDAYYSPSSPETDRRAFDYFKKACDGGYAASCNGLGLLHHEGRGVTQNDAEAVRLYYLSCLDGSSTGCEHLADAFRAGRGVAKDPRAADRAAARKACISSASLDGGDFSACPSLLGDGGR